MRSLGAHTRFFISLEDRTAVFFLSRVMLVLAHGFALPPLLLFRVEASFVGA